MAESVRQRQEGVGEAVGLEADPGHPDWPADGGAGGRAGGGAGGGGRRGQHQGGLLSMS